MREEPVLSFTKANSSLKYGPWDTRGRRHSGETEAKGVGTGRPPVSTLQRWIPEQQRDELHSGTKLHVFLLHSTGLNAGTSQFCYIPELGSI